MEQKDLRDRIRHEQAVKADIEQVLSDYSGGEEGFIEPEVNRTERGDLKRLKEQKIMRFYCSKNYKTFKFFLKQVD